MPGVGGGGGHGTDPPSLPSISDMSVSGLSRRWGMCRGGNGGWGGGTGMCLGGGVLTRCPPPSSVFWDLYCAAPDRRETCEHSSEAKAFHDYVSTAVPGGGLCAPLPPPHW